MNFCILPAQCIYVFRRILTRKAYYFPKKKKNHAICLCNGHTQSSVSRRQISGLQCVMWMKMSGHFDFFFDTLQSVQLKSAVMEPNNRAAFCLHLDYVTNVMRSDVTKI